MQNLRTLLGICVFGWLGISSAAEIPDHQRAMLEDAALADVAFVDARRGWAVGERGVIWHTDDGGGTWRVQHCQTDCRLHCVRFLDEQAGWAAGGVMQPYTHQSQAVLLRTLDGGRSWTAMPNLTLPMLRQVKFFSPTRGWAVGLPSALFPSGVFQTKDGGRSWSPIAGGGRQVECLCSDFRDMTSGALAGKNGSLQVVTTRGAIKSRTPSLGLRAIHDLQLVGEAGGWLAGDGGLIMRSEDGGLSWHLPPRPIPTAALQEFDFQAVTAVGPHVWFAGSPGTYVLHSPDAGSTWEMQPTGQPLPLGAITFVDERNGWAVGAMGTILATDDGGRNWRRQHTGGTRCALLLVLADGGEMPLELIAQLGADDGYLSAVELIGRRDAREANNLHMPADDRARGAFVLSGGSAAATAWQFPLRQAELALAPEKVIGHWDAAHDGRGIPELKAHLVRKIRQWRPDVIVTADPRSNSTPAESRIIAQLTADAAAAAGDSTFLTGQLAGAGLRPWQAKKVFCVVPPGEAGDVSLTTSQLAMRLGTSLADYCDDARGLLKDEPPAPPNLVEFRLLKHNVAPQTARREIFSGLVLHPGGEARRRLGDPPAGDIRALQKLAQRRRNVGQIVVGSLASEAGDAALLGELDELVEGMDDRTAAGIVRQLAARLQEAGRADLADEAMNVLLERYRDQPATDEAMMQMIRRLASAEISHQRQKRAGSFVRPASADLPLEIAGDSSVVRSAGLATEIRDGENTVRTDLAVRSTRAISLHSLLAKRRPVLASDPELQLALAASLRQTGDGQQALANYRRLLGLEETSPAAVCARAELWLADPRGDCPKPMVHCVLASEKPFLDGRLDDAVWQSAVAMEMRNHDDDDPTWPAVARLARDDQYLYVAVSCRRAAGMNYSASDEPRPRDADLSDRDRVEILLDVNRDWSTFYRLTVDHRGWTAERAGDDAKWNPTWFAAAAGDEQTWSAEAAIALVDLVDRPPQARELWGVNVQRIAPGVGMEGWSQPASVKGEALGLGLLFFE